MHRLLNNRPACLLLAGLALIYAAFLTADMLLPGYAGLSSGLKYVSVLICLLLAIVLHRSAYDSRESLLLISALALTCVADLFLLLLHLVPGLLAFCMVHLIYIRRYRKTAFLPACAAALSMLAVCAAAKMFFPQFPLQHALSGLYGILLLSVLYLSFFSTLPAINRKLAFMGMLLLFICDIHVALFNTLNQSSPYLALAGVFMWLFYLPSQLLLALSGFSYAE